MQSQITEWSTALMTSLSAAMAMFFSSIPKIIGFAVILIVGWLIAAVIEKAVAALLRTVKFNELSQRSGFSDFVHKMGTESDSSGMIALVVKWFVRLVALVVRIVRPMQVCITVVAPLVHLMALAVLLVASM